MIAIVDAGPLYAVVDQDDVAHVACREVLENPNLDLIVPALVVAEVCYFVGRRLGASAEAAFLRSLATLEVEAPTGDDWHAIADMVERHSDFPLGGADASVAVLADRLDTDLIVTLDRRHFGAMRSIHGQPFRILPE